MRLLQVGVGDALNHVNNAMSASEGNLQAMQAMNEMLIAAIIVIGVTLIGVVVLLWNKYQGIQKLYQQKEIEDNEFKAQFLADLQESTRAQRDLSNKINELVVKIENNSIDKLGNQIQSLVSKMVK